MLPPLPVCMRSACLRLVCVAIYRHEGLCKTSLREDTLMTHTHTHTHTHKRTSNVVPPMVTCVFGPSEYSIPPSFATMIAAARSTEWMDGGETSGSDWDPQRQTFSHNHHTDQHTTFFRQHRILMWIDKSINFAEFENSHSEAHSGAKASTHVAIRRGASRRDTSHDRAHLVVALACLFPSGMGNKVLCK